MPTSETNPPPPRIPDFDLLRRIGRGSYGEVWLARSVTGAWRAVKIVHRDRFDSARPYEREFQGIQKYEPVSRAGEGLVHLLHVSRGEDFFYYVMELADDAACGLPAAPDAGSPTRGRPAEVDVLTYEPLTLQALLKQKGRLSFDECLRVALALTRGLEQLHAGGLIHRDLKPSNIIIARGAPKLADIGLVTDADSTRTLVGTEGYLPPDGGGTLSADLYGLGKVLYEMSTGMDRQQFPVMPADFASLPDRLQILELSEIFEKACEALLSNRYASAAQMRADLELLVAGHSVVRRRRLGWFLRQSARAALFAALAAGLFAFGWWGRQRAPPTARHLSAIAQANSEFQAGRTALEKRTTGSLSNALLRFDAALRLDPGLALALSGRAEALALLATYQRNGESQLWGQARQAAEAARRRLPDLASPQFTLGLVAKNHEFAWEKAERYFRAGLAIDPHSAHGHQWYSSLLGALGRADEAVAAARRACELDPASRSANSNLGIQLHFARRYAEALAQYRRTLAIAPDFSSVHAYLSRLYQVTDRLHEGLIERLKTMTGPGLEQSRRRSLERARMQLGAPGFWREWLGQIEASESPDHFARAEAHLQLTNHPAALAALREAITHRDLSVLYLAVDPIFDPLRSNADFLALCDQLKLPRDASAGARRAVALALTEVERAAGLTAEEKAASFRLLFDGRSLQGWRADARNWSAVDGALVLTKPGPASRGHLRYTQQTVPENFELRFDWKVEPRGDSGVNYRPGFVEYQVVDNGVIQRPDRWRYVAGALVACIGHQHEDHTRPAGQWNASRIVCYGTTLEHWLNGLMQFRYDYTHRGLTNVLANLDREEMRRTKTTFGNVRARGGYLSLQDEGQPGAAFRALRWRKLE